MSVSTKLGADEHEAFRRIDALEAKLAFAEDLLETLNVAVYRQQQQIERLNKQLVRLAEQVAGTGASGETRNLKDEIPPHY